MGQFFDLAISPAALAAGWARVQANGGSAGGDGVSVNSFASLASVQLGRLHGELASNNYRPGPLRRVSIPKRSGGTRTLAIPCVIDRVAQTAVATALSLRLEPGFSPDSFAYRPGRSVKQAVARVALLRRQGYEYVVDGDIRAYFDNVPHGTLLKKIRAELDDTALLRLIEQWLSGWGTKELPARGLAQGSPLSPLLANLYLDGLDDLFANGPVRIVRFADDFLLLTKGARSAELALTRARDYLAEHGLILHPDKTRIVAFDQRLDFLGHLFVRSIVLEQEFADQAEALQSQNAALVAASQNDEDDLPFLPGPSEVVFPENIDTNTEQKLPPASKRAISTEILSGQIVLDDDELVVTDMSDFSAGLAPLYVLDRDATLSGYGDCFEVTQLGRTALRVPARSVGRVDAGKGVAVTQAAIRLAADHGIMLSLLDGEGRAIAALSPPTDDRAGLHLDQARQVLNDATRLSAARTLVIGKVRNQYALLKRLNRRRKLESVNKVCNRLKEICAISPRYDLDQVRGREGEAGLLYWPALGECLENGFGLVTRRTDPANPVNAVLDWLSHLVTRDMAAAILRAALHPGFGLLHATADRRDALAYDLVEVFRAPLAEGLMVYLFNNRVLAQDDFVREGTRTRMSSDAARRTLVAYEAWLARPIRNPRNAEMTSWRMLIQDEARAFAASVRDSSKPFSPYRMDW